MEDKVRVNKLIVRINGVSIELTIEEANKLQDSLNKLFGPEKEIVIKKEYWPYWVERPVTSVTYPWAYYHSSNPEWDNMHPTVYCCSN